MEVGVGSKPGPSLMADVEGIETMSPGRRRVIFFAFVLAFAFLSICVFESFECRYIGFAVRVESDEVR